MRRGTLPAAAKVLRRGPQGDSDPRRRNRPRADGGDAPRPRGDGRRLRVGRSARPAPTSWTNTAAIRCPTRFSTRFARPASRSRADHDAGRRRLPLRERRACARASTSTAQVRPCKTYPGVRTRFDDVDLIIVRENTEDLYAGIEYEQGSADAEELIGWIEAHGGKLAQRRRRHLDQADLRHGHAPDRSVRLRLRAPQRPPQGHGGAQGEHHEVHRRLCVCASRARSRRRTTTSSSTTGSWTTCACSSSSVPRSTTCSCCRTSTATSSRTSAPG